MPRFLKICITVDSCSVGSDFGLPIKRLMTTVLLADDHAIVRRGFSMILAAQSDFQIVAEVSNGREAVEQGENSNRHCA